MILFRILRTDKAIEKGYVNVGGNFGNALSYAVERICLLERWKEWEKEYSRRGYRTISLDEFINFGGYGKDISDLIGKKREDGEKPILYAELYEVQVKGKVKLRIINRKMKGIEAILEIPEIRVD